MKNKNQILMLYLFFKKLNLPVITKYSNNFSTDMQELQLCFACLVGWLALRQEWKVYGCSQMYAFHRLVSSLWFKSPV
jgi:hypothetical protein